MHCSPSLSYTWKFNLIAVYFKTSMFRIIAQNPVAFIEIMGWAAMKATAAFLVFEPVRT